MRKNRRIPFLSGYPERKGQILLLAALFLSSLFLFRDYLFGDKVLVFYDVGGDTMEQYVMHYASVVNHLRDGSFSFWDFTNGFGTNLFNLNLFDPALMLLIVIGVILGPAHMLLYVVWILILEILAAGLVFYRFLSEYPLGRRTKMLASFVYGLNGYLLVWGQHYQFGMITVYFPLLLLLCERFVTGRKGRRLLPLAVFLCGIYSVYLTYMSLAAAGVYLLIRVMMLEDVSFGRRMKKFLAGCGQMLLGVGMSLAVFLPTAAVILQSSRVGQEDYGFLTALKEGFSLYPWKYYETLIARMFSTNLQNLQTLGGGVYEGFWNYYEDPVLFCSTLSVFLNVQLLVVFPRTKLPRRVRAGVCTGAVLVLLVMILRMGGIAFNAFVGPTHRYTFVLIPFFLLGMAWMLEYLKEGGKISLLALILTFLVMNGVYSQGFTKSVFDAYKLNASLMAATGEVMVLCLAAMAVLKNPQGRKAVLGLLAVVTVLNVVLEGNICFQDRLTLKKQDTPAEEMAQAMEAYALSAQKEESRAAFLKPQEYFRELYREDLQEILCYLEDTDPEFYRVEKDFVSATLSMDAQAQGYRGISTYNSVMDGDLRKFLDVSYPELYLTDGNRLSFWDNAQDHWFGAFAGVRYLISRDADLDEARYALVGQFGSLYLYKNVMDAGVARFYDTAISQESYEALCTPENRETLLFSAIALEAGGDVDSMEELEGMSESASVVVDAPKKDSRLTGTVQAGADGYLLFTIPYDEGWSLTVDGKETELLRADLGFLACEMEAGEHTFRLSFRPLYLREGLLCSLVCWILYGVWLMWGRSAPPSCRRDSG